MIHVDQASRSYGDFLAVDQVSFDIPAGEVVGLLGHNGAGKTTIMKMLSGYLEPSGGDISIDGTSLADNPRAVQNILGYLPESLPIYPDMIVADYLDYAATLKGLSGSALRDSVRRAIRDTELQSKLIEPINTLSRGYRQRVGVAQAILGSPRVLILDEPTNGLDPSQTQHMRDLISAIAETATVILSTHIMQEVDAICNRALILNQGRLALNENLHDLRKARSLLLRTSLPAEKIQLAISGVVGIAGHEPVSGGYRLQLGVTADADVVAAEIATAVINAGGDLYHLQSEIRDLEAVFREVNAHGGIPHAA
jgi:ABC-2 type transport system ATP-binding protein